MASVRLAVLSTSILLVIPALTLAQSAEDFDSDDPPVEAAATAAKAPDLSEVEAQIVRRTNRFREKQDLDPVERNDELNAAAQYFANFMARTEKYGHTADGNRPSERAAEHGYEFCIVLENIAYRYSSAGFETTELAKGFVKGWKKSPGHRENMLDPDVTETGVAVAHSEDSGNYYAVQMFGRPRSQQIRFQVVNRAGEPVEYIAAPKEGDQSRTFDLPARLTRTHQRCRPTMLQFGFDESRSIVVEPNRRYVVTLGGSAEPTVETEELSAPEEEASNRDAD